MEQTAARPTALTPALPEWGYYNNTLQVIDYEGHTLTLDSCLSSIDSAFCHLRDWFVANYAPHSYSRAEILEVPAFYNGQPLDITDQSWVTWWK